jgi:hypothetical protein
MREQIIAVVVSVGCQDCTPKEAVEAFRDFLAESGRIPAGKDGEAELLDVNLLFPRRSE